MGSRKERGVPLSAVLPLPPSRPAFRHLPILKQLSLRDWRGDNGNIASDEKEEGERERFLR